MAVTELQGNNKRSFSMTNGSVLPGAGEREILEWVSKEFERCRKARIQFERTWYYNLAFYFGRQNVQWSPSFGTANGTYMRLFEPPAPPWRVRLVTNKIRPTVRTEHAKLTKENPEPYVIPASSDDDDLAKARAAEHIHEFIWRDLHGKKVIRRMAWWLVLTGNGFVKDWYDPTQLDSSGIPGVLKMEHVTPFHLWVPDMDEEEIENQPHITQVVAKTPDWVEQTYKKTVQADSSTGGGVLEQKFLQAMGIDKQTDYDHVAVRETHIKPCTKFPDGAVVSWLQDETLNISEGMPFGHTEYPYTKFDHIPTGRFYSESVITDLIPIQKEYNRTRSQIIEAKNKTAKPQLVAPRGSVDPRKMTSEPGLVIFYTPGFAEPKPLPLTPLPAYVLQELDRCQSDMDDISGQHEVSKGSTPAGVTAATAISYLQEQDDTKLGNTIASIEEGIEKLGKHLLIHVQEYWDLPRTVRVIGSDGEYEAFMFSGADIEGNTDLNIQSGSAMPRSRAAKQAYIMQLGQMGWIPPDRALRYLDMAETGRLYEELQIDARQAQRENLKMLNGQQVLVNTWDEHHVHVLEHNTERKKQRFESSDDNVKAMFEQHVQMHQMQMQMQMMQVQQGLGGGTQEQPGLPQPGQAQPQQSQQSPSGAPPVGDLIGKTGGL